jgi:hypothetical protein
VRSSNNNGERYEAKLSMNFGGGWKNGAIVGQAQRVA